MKKTILIIGFLLLFAANILAIPRTSSEALSIANSFYQKAQVSTKKISTELSTLKLAYTCTDGILNWQPHQHRQNRCNNHPTADAKHGTENTAK